MISATQMQQWMERPETLNRESLYEMRTLLARYPYFQLLRLLYLKNLYLLHDADFGIELRRAVPYVADRRKLFYLVEGDRYEVRPERSGDAIGMNLGEEPDVDRTLSLIDNFLASMPDEQPRPTRGTFDYAGDYTAYLLTLNDAPADEEETIAGQSKSEEPAPKTRNESLIDTFLNQPPEEEPASELDDTPNKADIVPMPTAEPATQAVRSDQEPDANVEVPAAHDLIISPTQEAPGAEAVAPQAGDDALDESCFTETLARIYVKQHRYEKALEIIKKLNEQIGLNNPKKSIYFADQIRFLEKLIINEKSK